ncbi:MAG: HPr family phosphocarrier protein [Halieaceae bacterium]|jgi:phosphocarrier protein|nr:HPr family phosphocarrier protein [Halieaceae bacterium]
MRRDALTIVNRLGLHARATSKFVACASRFESDIRVGKDGTWANGKSIMAVMMLAAGKGSVLELEIDGRDEDAAYGALAELVNDCFGEGG